MTTFLPKEVREGLDAARLAALKKSSRLRVLADDQFVPVLHMWTGGFAVESESAPALRGLVDLYEGARHLSQCLIVTSSEEDGEMRYDFKWSTTALDHAPLDFERDEDAPIALLGR